MRTIIVAIIALLVLFAANEGMKRDLCARNLTAQEMQEMRLTCKESR